MKPKKKMPTALSNTREIQILKAQMVAVTGELTKVSQDVMILNSEVASLKATMDSVVIPVELTTLVNAVAAVDRRISSLESRLFAQESALAEALGEPFVVILQKSKEREPIKN